MQWELSKRRELGEGAEQRQAGHPHQEQGGQNAGARATGSHHPDQHCAVPRQTYSEACEKEIVVRVKVDGEEARTFRAAKG